MIGDTCADNITNIPLNPISKGTFVSSKIWNEMSAYYSLLLKTLKHLKETLHKLENICVSIRLVDCNVPSIRKQQRSQITF